MEYIILIPIFIVIVYGLLLFKNKTKLYRILLISSTILIDFIIYLILIKYYINQEVFMMILGFNVLSYFIILRFENKVTIPFLLIFVLSISLLIFLSLVYGDVAAYLSFIVLSIFLLAENNQLFMRKSYEESAAEYQNKIINKQVEEVQNIYFTMRSWRHDYHNHLQKLKAHIMLNQITEANKYLNELEVDLDNVNQLVESGNVNLDAILNSKLSLAMKNEIDINYKANVPKKLTVSDIDLCVLIGNLIDNAVEACQKITDNNQKFIRLYIGIFKKQLYISVSNSTNEVIRKLDDEYITSKRGNHGHGLKRINNIVDKYSGYINRQNEPKVFVSEVLLPL